MIDSKKSICQIICQNQINGTGFYIGQGRIITATHVVEGFLDVQACFVEYDENQYIYMIVKCRKYNRIQIFVFY